jgi:hypothetical protein
VSDPHARLEAAMRKRRLELGMKTWRDLAIAADISYETIRKLRTGEGVPAEGTLHGLERALQWAHGSIDNTLAGGDPTPIDRRAVTGTASGVITATGEARGEVTRTDDLDELLQDPEARAALRTIIRKLKGEPPEPDSPGRDEQAG